MRRVNCRQPRQPCKPTWWAILPYLYDFDKPTFERPTPVRCKRRSTKPSFVKVGAFLVIVGVSWFGLHAIPETVGYFSDRETSGGNVFDAALLDFALASQSDFFPPVSPQENAVRVIQVQGERSIAFQYRIKKHNTSGELCDLLNLQVFLGSEQRYSGPLNGFIEDGDFAFLNPEHWIFIVHLTTNDSDFNGKICQFVLEYQGWQIPFFSGFRDAELISNTITANIPPAEHEDDEKLREGNKEIGHEEEVGQEEDNDQEDELPVETEEEENALVPREVVDEELALSGQDGTEEVDE